MSNYAAIALTKFQDLKRDGSVSDVSYGMRVYDDYASTYDNIAIGSEEELLAMTDAQIVEMAAGINETAAGIIEHARENHEGIEIWGEWTSWKQLGLDSPSA